MKNIFCVALVVLALGSAVFADQADGPVELMTPTIEILF
jgi:hypothetical protein